MIWKLKYSGKELLSIRQNICSTTKIIYFYKSCIKKQMRYLLRFNFVIKFANIAWIILIESLEILILGQMSAIMIPTPTTPSLVSFHIQTNVTKSILKPSTRAGCMLASRCTLNDRPTNRTSSVLRSHHWYIFSLCLLQDESPI